MNKLTIAIDRSARRTDVDGRLHIDRSHISKANICPYYGREIPGFEQLGLDANRIYRLYRDPVELERGAPTFERLPILSKHVPITVANVAADEELKKLIVGAIGSKVVFDSNYLDADLCVWDAKAIAGIDTEQVKELSCGYRYVPLMEPGECDEGRYDGRMTEIVGNHLALVEVGRAGADVVVADQNPFINFRDISMKMTKLGKALFAALCATSGVLAADSALPALVGQADRKNFNAKDVKSKLLALDEKLNPVALDSVIDSLLDVDNTPEPVVTPEAVADTPADKIRALLAGKVDDATIEQIVGLLAAPATDADPDAKEDKSMKPEEVKAAMDGLRKELREAADAARDVRNVVGDVAMDSATEIYAFALDQMKVDRKDVEGVAALRALFKVASQHKPTTTTTVVAMDSLGMKERFPNANRFRQA